MSQSCTLSIPKIKLVYSSNSLPKNRKRIDSPQKAFEYFVGSWEKNTIELNECFKILLLNNQRQTLGMVTHSRGGLVGTIVDIRQLYAAILLANAPAFIICHNHPSGIMRPSSADIELTEKIKKGAELLDLKLLDHLIISETEYFSFTEGGIM